MSGFTADRVKMRNFAISRRELDRLSGGEQAAGTTRRSRRAASLARRGGPFTTFRRSSGRGEPLLLEGGQGHVLPASLCRTRRRPRAAMGERSHQVGPDGCLRSKEASDGVRPTGRICRLTDDVITAHLAGTIHAGLYPLMDGDTCRLLACDFDGPLALLDALAYTKAARSFDVPTALEVSRSGSGAHVWMFFADAVAATTARRVGAGLLREAIAIRGELDLASYDRLFPAQDFLPASGSIGNLIALPLQGRVPKAGNDRLPRPGHAGAPRGPVRLPVACGASHPEASGRARRSDAAADRRTRCPPSSRQWSDSDAPARAGGDPRSLGSRGLPGARRVASGPPRLAQARSVVAQSGVLQAREAATVHVRRSPLRPLLPRGSGMATPASRPAGGHPGSGVTGRQSTGDRRRPT